MTTAYQVICYLRTYVWLSYTVNSLPGGNNHATLRSLRVTYRAILRSGSDTRNVPLNGGAAAGVVSFSGLTRNTAYRVTYRVEVGVSFQVTLPSDIADPIQVFITRTCTGQCSAQLQHCIRLEYYIEYCAKVFCGIYSI